MFNWLTFRDLQTLALSLHKKDCKVTSNLFKTIALRQVYSSERTELIRDISSHCLVVISFEPLSPWPL